jgi:hypothetical protein
LWLTGGAIAEEGVSNTCRCAQKISEAVCAAWACLGNGQGERERDRETGKNREKTE